MVATCLSDLLPGSQNSVVTATAPAPAEPASPVLTTTTARAPQKPTLKSTSPATAATPKTCKPLPLESDIFAKLISPRPDARLHDKIFEAYCDALADQFEIGDLARLWLHHQVAADMVLLTRVRQAIELVMAPAGLSKEVIKEARLSAEYDKWAKSLRRVLENSDAGRSLDCTSKEADELAPRLAEELRTVRNRVGQAQQDDADEAAHMAGMESLTGRENPEPDGDCLVPPQWCALAPEELEEREQDRRLLGSFSPIEPLLTDPAKTKAVLCGFRVLSETELPPWKAVVTLAAQHATGTCVRSQKAVAEAEAAERATLNAFAANPDALIKLHRFAAELEAGIERRVKALRAG